MPDNVNYKAKISIENFPSRSEVLLLLDKFINKNKYDKDYITENKDKAINILFKTKDIAHEFLQCLIFEQSRNALYKQTKFSLSLLTDIPKERAKIKTKINSYSIERLHKGLTPNHPLRDKLNERRQKKRTLPYSILISEKYVSQSDLFKENKKEDQLKFISMASFVRFSKFKSLDSNHLNEPLTEETRVFKCRPLQKSKWISPTNFVI